MSSRGSFWPSDVRRVVPAPPCAPRSPPPRPRPRLPSLEKTLFDWSFGWWYRRLRLGDHAAFVMPDPYPGPYPSKPRAPGSLKSRPACASQRPAGGPALLQVGRISATRISGRRNSGSGVVICNRNFRLQKVRPTGPRRGRPGRSLRSTNFLAVTVPTAHRRVWREDATPKRRTHHQGQQQGHQRQQQG